MSYILVVDDEIGIRELLSEILSDEGHVVDLAENAAAARACREVQTPDLILLDIWMPDTDGVTLLKEWAANGMLTVPVIMMSGHGTIDTAVEATRIGAIDFLEKPIALQKLLSAVQKGLEVRSRPAKVSAARPAMLLAGPDEGADYASVLTGSAPQLLAATNANLGNSASNTIENPELKLDLPLREARDAFERAYFEYHLARENGSMTRVAAKTGLERTHLYRKLKQLGIELTRPTKN
jgi:DNA-binding NtrC family response regulator